MEALKATVQPLADKDKKESPFSKEIAKVIKVAIVMTVVGLAERSRGRIGL